MDPTPKPTKISDIVDPKSYSFKAESLETAADRKARIRREDEDAAHERSRKKADQDHERRKDFVLFVSSIVIVTGAALTSVLALILSPGRSAWAAPLLTLIVGGLLGYQTGKSQSPKAGT
jgi:VIT1/CCC1 family predicted Fe2+/Mn2+ transporter